MAAFEHVAGLISHDSIYERGRVPAHHLRGGLLDFQGNALLSPGTDADDGLSHALSFVNLIANPLTVGIVHPGDDDNDTGGPYLIGQRIL